jgi:hypothetical protein
MVAGAHNKFSSARPYSLNPWKRGTAHSLSNMLRWKFSLTINDINLASQGFCHA